MIWDQLTAKEIGDLDRSIPVILPMAATEQHGAHLPLATDRMIGEHFASKLHEAIPGDVLILPAAGVGCSDHHMDFSGTLTLDHDTFISYITGIVESVIHHGFTSVILLNSHGGNQGAGQVLVEKLGYKHPDNNIVMTSWWQIVRQQLLEVTETDFGGVGHAGEFETSLMLVIAGDLVRSGNIEKGANQPVFEWAAADLLHGPSASWYRTMKQLTPNGIFGQPEGATAEKGSRITELVVEGLLKVVQDLRHG